MILNTIRGVNWYVVAAGLLARWRFNSFNKAALIAAALNGLDVIF
jgi:hypothetical protein